MKQDLTLFVMPDDSVEVRSRGALVCSYMPGSVVSENIISQDMRTFFGWPVFRVYA